MSSAQRTEWYGEAGRQEFGDFLRSRRARLDPAALGLPSLRRRRTPGLRREEVAERAGIGADWYTRLEQGREVNPSATTIDALARALLLTDAERAHLHALAGTERWVLFTREAVPPALEGIVRAMPLPAYITGQRWDLLVWNAAAAELFMDFGAMPEERRNILAYILTEPSARALFGPTWEGEARRMVAQFRANFGLWAGDPAFEALVSLLQAESAEFRAWWATHEVRAQATGRKLLNHPRLGRLEVEYATLQANDDLRLKLVLYRLGVAA